MRFELGSAIRPLLGETECGDALGITQAPYTRVLLVDGLGHGEGAAEASQALVAFCADKMELEPAALLSAGSQAISHTRGAAAMVADFFPGTRELRVAGVGNIELFALSAAKISPICSPGVLGRPVRKIQEYHFLLHPGDRFALITDGVSRRLDLTRYESTSPSSVAAQILADFGKASDDAACVVVDCRGTLDG